MPFLSIQMINNNHLILSKQTLILHKIHLLKDGHNLAESHKFQKLIANNQKLTNH